MWSTGVRGGLMILASMAALSCVAAKPGPKLTANGEPAATVSGVTVTASRSIPHVESTFPAAGAKVTPGLLVLRVTYDTRMRPEGWAFARETGLDYPDCATTPRLLDDGRTFVLICRTMPGKSYAIWFNRPPLQDFASVSRRPAVAYELSFATTDDDPVRTLKDAMKQDPALAGRGNPVEPPGVAVYGQDADNPGDQR